MDASILKGLNDKLYDKRKASALEVEKIIRDALLHNDAPKVRSIIDQLVELASSTSSHHSNTRNGGIMGLAGASIALGQQHIAPYLGKIAPPILACFHDPDHRVRYFACESMYNVAKVAKGEVLIYFNELFDAMSKLAADVDQAVKNGGELLDRLIKDIVTEQASTYVSARPTTPDPYEPGEGEPGGELEKPTSDAQAPAGSRRQARKAFSLARFIPLLAERIYVINPFTRTYLVGWLTVLDSIPELELVSYLPSFLDGLLKFLGDPTEDIRNATTHVLAGFLREIREAAEVTRIRAEAKAARLQRRQERQRVQSVGGGSGTRAKSLEPGDMSLASEPEAMTRSRPASRRQSLDRRPAASTSPTSPVLHPRERDNQALVDIREESSHSSPEEAGSGETESESEDSLDSDEEDYDDIAEGEGPGTWVPGQGVLVDHGAIVEILLQHLSFPDEEIQATCLRWIAEFLLFVKDTMVSFTPRLIPVILSSLAHHVPAIRQAALQTNFNLFRVVQQLPAPPSPTATESEPAPPQSSPQPQPEQGKSAASSQSTHSRRGSANNLRVMTSTVPFPGSSSQTSASSAAQASVSSSNRLPSMERPAPQPNVESMLNGFHIGSGEPHPDEDTVPDPFDYQATVNALTLQFLNENEETRVAALQWLSMLHQKAPRKILSMHDGTFPALLKTLSDPSEDVIKADLQLLAQISSSSEDDYFPLFMANLLSLFSTDRKLLETRGSLIIRQLCLSLNTERIYRTFADLLAKDEDLEFASIMVQNLHLIMITSPEIADFRKRLKNLETKDGQVLFSNLYRSWSHNAVAAFSLCLLAQAYEHAANLLQIFADLEVTVSLLIQIDKLVQLLESPVFTSLRLQLLEPEKYPYLYKCLYGLLMFLPQSSAFLTLRNRLNAVSPLGYLHAAPKSSSYAASASGTGTTGVGPRSTIRRGDEIKWQELLTHFRQLQMKHERARRAQPSDGDVSASSSGLQITAGPRPTSGNTPVTGGGGGGLTATGSSSTQHKRRGTQDSHHLLHSIGGSRLMGGGFRTTGSHAGNVKAPMPGGGSTPGSIRPLSPQSTGTPQSRNVATANRRLPYAGGSIKSKGG